MNEESEEIKKVCGNCRYYHGFEYQGNCRRRSPIKRECYTSFPEVSIRDWCGDFEYYKDK